MVKKVFKEFPKVIGLGKIMGPSFVLIALGLGSGEIILWPYLVSNYGLGIAWGAACGIIFQYFINMEVERYALVRGESVFVGFSRRWRGTPLWFIISTFLGFGLPGIVAASAHILSYLFFGLENFRWVAMGLLLIIGLVLSMGKTVYGLLEKVTKTYILIGVPFLIVLAAILVKPSAIVDLGHGLIGIGNDFWLLPAGISLATFFGAFAYAGAGGNLNLSQSIYVKEKGFGMGKYSQKIAGLFSRDAGHQEIKLAGESFAINATNVKRFQAWWRKINAEHLIVFLFIGLLAICLLMLLSYSTVFGLADNKNSVQFIINEGSHITDRMGLVIGALFFLITGIMLFQSQMGIYDSSSRIMSENYAIRKVKKTGQSRINLSRVYSIFLWAQILFGEIVFFLNIYEPKTLIVIGAVINAVAMFVYLPMIHFLNKNELAKPFRPVWWRTAMMFLIFVFFGVFTAITLWTKGGELFSLFF